MVERRRQRILLLKQLPLLVALVLLWMLLWGSLSLLNLVTGIVVAVVVTRVFYLPPVELSGRFNPFRFVWLLVALAGELVAASVSVAGQALDPRGVRGNAMVAVPLRTRSDFAMTLTAIAVSLVPGSIVVEIDRADSVLYLHALGVRDDAGVERVRRSVLATERRVVLALGSRDDVRRMAS